jgi:hypothetical protein
VCIIQDYNKYVDEGVFMVLAKDTFGPECACFLSRQYHELLKKTYFFHPKFLFFIFKLESDALYLAMPNFKFTVCFITHKFILKNSFGNIFSSSFISIILFKKIY